MDSKSLALLCGRIADDKKASEIKILHVEDVFVIADYFVICSGENERHIRGIASEIEVEIKKNNIKIYSVEGYEQAKWILMDLQDVIVHIYLAEIRNYYELEDLWADAQELSL